VSLEMLSLSLANLNLHEGPSGSDSTSNTSVQSRGGLSQIPPSPAVFERLSSSIRNLTDISQATARRVTCIEKTLNGKLIVLCDLKPFADHFLGVRRGKILRWISPEPHQLYHKQRNLAQAVGASDTVRNHGEFRLWQTSESSSLLWINGISGCGKSTIA